MTTRHLSVNSADLQSIKMVAIDRELTLPFAFQFHDITSCASFRNLPVSALTHQVLSRDELPTALSGIPEALLRPISCHTPDLVTPHGLFPFAALSCMYLIAFIVVSFSLTSASASAATISYPPPHPIYYYVPEFVLLRSFPHDSRRIRI